MQANLLRVKSPTSVIVHIPGPGSVVCLNLDMPLLEMARAVCVTPLHSVKCTVTPGEYKDGEFHGSTVSVQWPRRKRARPVYKRDGKN